MGGFGLVPSAGVPAAEDLCGRGWPA